MSPQRYEAVAHHDDEDGGDSPIASTNQHMTVPASPPPSFRSRESRDSSADGSRSRRLLAQDPMLNDVDRDLADTFGDGEGSDDEDDEDERQRFMRGNPSSSNSRDQTPPAPTHSSQQQRQQSEQQSQRRIERRVTELPAFQPPPLQPRANANDGVFANLAAKLDHGEQVEEKPPTYEQAAADATPPYWETTILAPGLSSDEVYVDGLPVGSLFSFIWNGMISMSFQLVGFLLTYLLHTTHAAKNGSRAGLGLTLVQYGFYMRGGGSGGSGGSDPSDPRNGGAAPGSGNPGQFSTAAPPDPNSHTFDPNSVNGAIAAATGGGSATGPAAGVGGGGLASISSSDWVSYLLMIVGWFILIRAVSDYLRARKQEQLILSSPSRGLPVAVVSEDESPEHVA